MYLHSESFSPPSSEGFIVISCGNGFLLSLLCSSSLRLLSATGTIFSVANYLWPPSEYTIAIVLVTDCHRAVTVIIFTFWRFLKCPRKPFCPNLDEARWTRDRHQPPLIQLPMILGFRQPDRQQTWQPPVLPAAERQQSVAAWPKSSEAGRCHGAR